MGTGRLGGKSSNIFEFTDLAPSRKLAVRTSEMCPETTPLGGFSGSQKITRESPALALTSLMNPQELQGGGL